MTCELDETSNLKKLSCSVESQTQPSYEWSGPDKKQSGPTLLVKEQEENRNSVYTCTVKNKAGSRTTDFTLQDCHTGVLVNHSAQYLETLMVNALSCFLNGFVCRWRKPCCACSSLNSYSASHYSARCAGIIPL